MITETTTEHLNSNLHELDKETCQLYDRNIRTWGKANQIR